MARSGMQLMSGDIREEGRGRWELGEKRTQTELLVRAEPMRVQPPLPIPYGAPPAVSIIQAGLMLNVSHSTIYRMIGAKRLKAIKVGARTVIPVALLDAILQADEP